MTITIEERIITGIKDGVNRHWSYTQVLLNIKPEYLLTISVADSLVHGFNNIPALQLEIKLEEKTHSICGHLLIHMLLDRKMRSQALHIAKNSIHRKGKVDIYVIHEPNSWIVELKGFNPSWEQIKKELIRLCQFLSIESTVNKIVGCYIAFPTLENKESWLKNKLNSLSSINGFNINLKTEPIETNEDPEDGIPVYFVNCISITLTPQSTNTVTDEIIE